jgi:hypothetical protein
MFPFIIISLIKPKRPSSFPPLISVCHTVCLPVEKALALAVAAIELCSPIRYLAAQFPHH